MKHIYVSATRIACPIVSSFNVNQCSVQQITVKTTVNVYRTISMESGTLDVCAADVHTDLYAN